MTRSFQKMQRRSYDVTDETGSISLTVWGPEALTVGKWYKKQTHLFDYLGAASVCRQVQNLRLQWCQMLHMKLLK